jgi:RNA polymerase sigma-70 factor (ECF subfamily)
MRVQTDRRIEAIRLGDQAAFAEYYESSVDRLVRAVMHITGDEEEARNIAQDSYVKLWQQRDAIEHLDGFLFTTASNAAFDALKRRASRTRYQNEQMFLQSGGYDIPADAGMLTMEIERLIESAIERMPPQRRRIFEMNREEGLTYTEIARRMNLSYNTVRNHMALALSDIRSVVTMLALAYFTFFR